MARNRIKGDSITFVIDETDYKLDATSIVFTHVEADNDVVTFADAEDGGAYEVKCNITALQSTDADAFHTLLWENGGTDVDFSFAPHGNETPSVAQPHFTGTIKLTKQMPDVGGQANSVWTFQKEFDVEGFTRVTTGA